tara:strand:+ start:1970 stop:2200 length:231 start_codon:yes stop_codon:yes gene_type:complete
MTYNVEDIEKIAAFTSWNDRKKIDKLLEIDADIYCNLGIESTKTEIENAKKQSRKIYRIIKTIDKYWGGMMLREQL